MPDFLVIEWDPLCLRGLDVQTSGGTIQVRHAFEMPQPSGHSQPALKEWFVHYLAEKHITTKQVIVTLPRESVVVRRLELPDAPDDELPQMVRFQAAAKSSLSLDELALDFIPLPRREGSPTREVLLAMVPQTMVTAIRDFIDEGQRELLAIRLSPIGAAELVAHLEDNKPLDPKSATLIVVRHGERVEISVVWMRQLIFSHAARLAGDTTEQQNAVILTEVSRGLMSFQNLNLGFKLTDGFLLGPDGDLPGLAEALQKRLPITVRTVNPFSLVKVAGDSLKLVSHQSAYAGHIGSVWSQTHPLIESLDFLAPRKPVIKPDTTKERRKKWAVVGGIAAVCVIAIYGIAVWQLNSGISRRTDELVSLDDALKKGKPMEVAAKTIDDWVQEDANVLDEMQRFEQQLPNTERVYLSKLSVNAPTSRQPAEIRAEGHAREEKDIRQLREKLIVPETGYKIAADEIKSDNKEYYPKKLNEQIKIGKVAAVRGKPAEAKKAVPAAKVGASPKAASEKAAAK
ncbi:MAG: Fimbrial assembly family protein [Planctomycetaceae bacterium]|nr:Fimbrial assembly family protein [Planctomycetaceae bacterium]